MAKNRTGTSGPDEGSAPEGDGGQAEVQERFDEEQEKGYRGERADTTPLENYTVRGVTSGATTPESAAPDEEGSARKDPEAVYNAAGDPIATDAPGENKE